MFLSVQSWHFTSDELHVQQRCKKVQSYSIQQGQQGCSSTIIEEMPQQCQGDIIKLIYKLPYIIKL